MENTCRFYAGQDIIQMGSMIDANMNEKLVSIHYGRNLLALLSLF